MVTMISHEQHDATSFSLRRQVLLTARNPIPIIWLCVIIIASQIALFCFWPIRNDLVKIIGFFQTNSDRASITSLSDNSAYKQYFPDFSSQQALNLSTQRLQQAINNQPRQAFPPDSITPTRGRTTRPDIGQKSFVLIDSTPDTICMPVTNSENSICFNILSNAFFSGSGVAIDVDNATVYELGGGCCMQDWKRLINTKVRLGAFGKSSYRLYHDRVILVLCQHHGTTYHHVLFEVMPRFMLSWPLLTADKRILVAIDTSDVTMSLLTHLGLERERIIQVDRNDTANWYGAGLLVYPPIVLGNEHNFALTRGLQVQAVAEVLRGSVVRHNSNTKSENTKKKVVLMERALTRGRHGDCRESRCVKNFKELHAALRSRLGDLDFHVYGPRETLSSTVSLFSSADVVIGIHGAGFQNLSFCKPNTTVIHIGFGNHYKWLADIMSTNYHAIIVDGLQRGSKNVVLDVPKVVDQIVSILNETDGSSS